MTELLYAPMSSGNDHRPKLLLVDDEPTNLQVLRQILQQEYRLLFAKDGPRALELAAAEQPALILLDVMMPGLTGLDTCRQLKQSAHTAAIPVIFVTALNDTTNETEGFEAGAVDYITKPLSAPIVRARVRTHISLVRVEELTTTRLQVIQRLGRAAEFRDNETGMHVIRMSHYARLLALRAGLGEQAADDIFHAAPMHDVGKIGIPDAILLKQGALDADEWDVMRRHCQIGAEIIGEHPSGLLCMARSIALSHHEKWNGSGYPNGLAGEAIPLEGRVVAVADVFDALTSTRPYKHAWDVNDAIGCLHQNAGTHFDPALVQYFTDSLPDILAIKARWPDES